MSFSGYRDFYCSKSFSAEIFPFYFFALIRTERRVKSLRYLHIYRWLEVQKRTNEIIFRASRLFVCKICQSGLKATWSPFPVAFKLQELKLVQCQPFSKGTITLSKKLDIFNNFSEICRKYRKPLTFV